MCRGEKVNVSVGVIAWLGTCECACVPWKLKLIFCEDVNYAIRYQREEERITGNVGIGKRNTVTNTKRGKQRVLRNLSQQKKEFLRRAPDVLCQHRQRRNNQPLFHFLHLPLNI